MYQQSEMLTEAKKAKYQPKLYILVLIIFVLFITAYLLPQIILSNIFNRFPVSGTANEIAFLFLNIITIAAGILYCTKIEKRSLRSMGFTKKRVGRQYILGLAVSLLMVLFIMGGSALFGAVMIETGRITPMAILFFFGFVIQGMSEEVALRGCFMVSAARSAPISAAIVINVLFFTIPHYFFSGGQLLFTANVFLMGIFLSIYMLRTDNIWGVSGLHTGFNFLCRCLFNSNSDAGNSLFQVTSNIPGKEWIGGNSYGISSGLMWTVCIILFTAMLFIGEKYNT